MAPPKPPPSSHQTTPATSHNRPPSARQAQLRTSAPEEQDPAILGRVEGNAPPPAGNGSTAQVLSSPSIPASAGDASSAARGVERVRNKQSQLGSSNSGGRLPFPAVNKVAGMLLQSAISLNSSDLGLSEGRGGVEGSQGFTEMPSGLATSGLPDNGGLPKPARIWPDNARQVLDDMSVRDLSLVSGFSVHLEAEEVWEKGPKTVLREGSSVRATFTPSMLALSRGSPGAGGAGQLPPTNHNAESSRLPGTSEEPPLARVAQEDGHGGPGSAPGRAGWTVNRLDSSSLSGLSGRAAIFQQIQGDAQSPEGGLQGPSTALREANTTSYTTGGAGHQGGTGAACTGGSNVAKNWAAASQSASDFEIFGGATDLASVEGGLRGQGELEAGILGYASGVERGGLAHTQHYAGPFNRWLDPRMNLRRSKPFMWIFEDDGNSTFLFA